MVHGVKRGLVGAVLVMIAMAGAVADASGDPEIQVIPTETGTIVEVNVCASSVRLVLKDIAHATGAIVTLAGESEAPQIVEPGLYTVVFEGPIRPAGDHTLILEYELASGAIHTASLDVKADESGVAYPALEDFAGGFSVMMSRGPATCVPPAFSAEGPLRFGIEDPDRGCWVCYPRRSIHAMAVFLEGEGKATCRLLDVNDFLEPEGDEPLDLDVARGVIQTESVTARDNTGCGRLIMLSVAGDVTGPVCGKSECVVWVRDENEETWTFDDGSIRLTPFQYRYGQCEGLQWCRRSEESSSGEWALRSGMNVQGGESSVLALALAVDTPSSISFRLMTSIDRTRDAFGFYIDGQLAATWADANVWTQAGPYELGIGTHYFSWVFEKGRRESLEPWQDCCVWVDDVAIVDDPTP